MKNNTKRNQRNNKKDKKDKKSSTVKNKPNKPNKPNNKNEQKEIVLKFLSLFVTIKLWHWKTNLYSIHKSTDEFLESFLDPLDFKNIKIKKGGIPNQWIDYKKICSNFKTFVEKFQ